VALLRLRPSDPGGTSMSPLDVHVQKCGECRWEISLSGEDAGERGLVTWVAHVAALHPARYRAARWALLDLLSLTEPPDAAEQQRTRQWLCAQGGHGGSWTTAAGMPLQCDDCGGIITIDWLKAHYEAQGLTVKVVGDQVIVSSEGHGWHEPRIKPPDEGETADVGAKPYPTELHEQAAKLSQVVADGLRPVLEQAALLVAKMLEPPIEHAEHLRDKLNGKG
jgi:hypothetical protein